MQHLTLSLSKYTLAILKLLPDAIMPEWIFKTPSNFLSITRTTDELSIVCDQSIVPESIELISKDWCVLKVEGPLDFSLTGILSALLLPLAEHKISVFTISTFDTDYILVKKSDLESALNLLDSLSFCSIQKL